jgi:predicted RNase H-like nuclease
MTETPMQRVEYLLSRVKEEEAHVKAAEDLREKLYRSNPDVTKVTAEPVRNGWRFWARTKRHSPYVQPVVETEFVLTDDEIETFQHFLDEYARRHTAAKESYEDKILHPEEDR